MSWWAILLAWCVLSITAASAWAAMCYARDLRAEREDRMRKAIALRNRIAALSLNVRSMIADQDGPMGDAIRAELEGILVEAARTGVPFDAEGGAW